MQHVLKEAWTKGIYLQSNFARQHAFDLAKAASHGYITTCGLDGSSWNRWLITPEGLRYLWDNPPEPSF